MFWNVIFDSMFQRWQNCKSNAADLLELWKYAFTLSSSFKIPKKMRDKEKKNPSPVKVDTFFKMFLLSLFYYYYLFKIIKITVVQSSLIRPSTFKRPIKVDERNAGWQSTVKRDRRDSNHRSIFISTA